MHVREGGGGGGGGGGGDREAMREGEQQREGETEHALAKGWQKVLKRC